MALIISLLAVLLMTALGAAAVLTTSAETRIAASFRNAHESLSAADAALQIAIADLDGRSDWNAVLSGNVRSAFIDGPPTGSRTLSNGSWLDLDAVVNTANCRKTAACSSPDLVAITTERPWGANNPVWRLFVDAPLATLLPNRATAPSSYVIVLVSDDASENDGDPLRDGDTPSNPGAGVLMLRAEAFGPGEAHQVIEATIRRRATAVGVQVLSWRHVK
jgi:hypothetical protein